MYNVFRECEKEKVATNIEFLRGTKKDKTQYEMSAFSRPLLLYRLGSALFMLITNLRI